MLKLINIVKNNGRLEADYVPENSSKSAHIALDIETYDYTAEKLSEYGTDYSRMAANGLIRTIEEIRNGKRKKIPEQRIVMWY